MADLGGRWWAVAMVLVTAAGCGKKHDHGDGGGHGREGRPHDGRGRHHGADASPSAQPPAPAPPPPSGSPRAHPNILFVLTDDQRADSIACMNGLARMVAEKGVTFSQSFATTPLCCPGRSTLLTGKYAHNHGVLTNADSEDGDDVRSPGAIDFQKNGNEELVVAKWLRDGGYRTGMFGKYLNGYEKMLKKRTGLHVPPHWDDWFVFPHAEFYGFDLVERPKGGKVELVHYETPVADGAKHKKVKHDADRVVSAENAENYSTDVLAEKVVAFVRDAAKEKRPFFAYFAPKAPHAPYTSPRRYQPEPGKAEFTKAALDRVGQCPLFEWKARPPSVLEDDVRDKPEWIVQRKGRETTASIDAVRKKQLVSVLAVEDALEKILQTLDEVGARGDTVIIYAGDNGYAWGEHGWIGKNCAYEECARVPLLILDPRHPQAHRVEDAFVLNTDVAPTIAELAGVTIPPGTKVDGHSLAAVARGEKAPPRDRLLVECWGTQKKAHPTVHSAVRTAKWKYVEHYDDDARKKPKVRADGAKEIELYDLEKDPHELENLARVAEEERQKKGYAPGEVDRTIADLAQKLRALEVE